MKPLERPEAPECLAEYDHHHQTWDNLTSTHYREVRGKLVGMQGAFCAYCECAILGDEANVPDNVKQHIEHFRRKGRNPSVTFQWENLFLSCYKSESCGRYKDKLGEIDYDLLIKPDQENPEEHLLFLRSGKVIPRVEDPSTESNQKAAETIRVFRLNGKRNPLRFQRANAIKKASYFQETMSEFLEEPDFSTDDVLEIIREELKHLTSYPHFTAIKHAYLPEELHLEV